jgi:biopolymer transport protein ExbD
MNHLTDKSVCQPRTPSRTRTAGQAALTPLLDTLFLLLFSVLAASDGAEARADIEQEVRLELPTVSDDGSGEGASPESPPVVIMIDADGAVTLDGGAMPIESPGAFADALLGIPSGAAFEIRAHADARHAVIVEVLHGLREASFLDVSLVANTRPADADPGAWGSTPR